MLIFVLLLASCVQCKGNRKKLPAKNVLHCKNLIPAVLNGVINKINPFKSEDTFSEVQERVEKLLTATPLSLVNTEMLPNFNPHSAELYYRFLTYATLAYSSEADIIKFSNTIGPDFYTGISTYFLKPQVLSS
jgi:hypothetical protein